MCDVAKELSNATDSISNALGTDGSKNGLLNDPISMAAVAVATGAYFAPELGLTGAAASAGTGAAATESGLLALDVIAPATNTAVASVTAGGAATAGAAGSWIPSWFSMDTALSAAKIAAPAIIGNNKSAQQFSQQKELLQLQNQHYAPTGYGTQALQPGGVTVKGLGSFLPMLIIGGAAFAAYKLTR